MKVICVKIPTYTTTAKYTLYKIYETFDSYGNPCILDDDGERYLVADKIFIPLDEWRELIINKILEE